MSPSKLPTHYVTRLDAKEAVGKSPKTIYREIRKAIEAGDEKAKSLLPHCKLQLKDGEVIDGNAIESMQQIDQFRQAGRYPTWWLDPEEFSAYFNPPAKAKATSSSDHEEGVKPTSKTSSGDGEVILQMQIRLDEKDERIIELKDDKQFYRKHVDTLGGHLERITGLLSHAQLQALGLPKGYKYIPPVLEGNSGNVTDAEFTDSDDTGPEQSEVKEKEGSTPAKPESEDAEKQESKPTSSEKSETSKTHTQRDEKKKASKKKSVSSKQPVSRRKTTSRKPQRKQPKKESETKQQKKATTAAKTQSKPRGLPPKI